jgi:hypothetical protein
MILTTGENTMKKNLLLILGMVMFSVAGLSAEDLNSPDYEVLVNDGQMEVRAYAPYLVASVVYDESKGESKNSAFRILFKYISGANVANESIAMTSPVLDAPGKKIPMTSPVLDESKNGLRKMSFMVPVRYNINTVPMPTSSRVLIEEVPARIVAANRFSWFASKAKQVKKAKQLKNWINSLNQFNIISKSIYAGYDAPLTLPHTKRHEMMFVIEMK